MNPQNTNAAMREATENWIPLLELASREVFDLMLVSQLEIAPQPQSDAGLDVTTMVGLAGKMCGLVAIQCATLSAIRMASKMLGTEVEKPGTETWDALGEVCNMVAGNFKIKIPGMGDGCLLSVPTVIKGGNYRFHSASNSRRMQTGFLFEGALLLVSLEIKSLT
jgi:chemotaxis protein CheX